MESGLGGLSFRALARLRRLFVELASPQRSAADWLSSAPISRAFLIKSFDCSLSSCLGGLMLGYRPSGRHHGADLGAAIVGLAPTARQRHIALHDRLALVRCGLSSRGE